LHGWFGDRSITDRGCTTSNDSSARWPSGRSLFREDKPSGI
jgi:hypothetical protein